MLDLTGGHFVSYIRRIIEDAVSRNPRFRQTLGDVKHPYNNALMYRDVQVIVKDVSSSGTRLSPNYFMCTQMGRAILAKIQGKDGSFLEWVSETDATRQTPDAGIYYINVDAVNPATNEVDLTIHKYRWIEGSLSNAQGSVLYFSPGIDTSTVTIINAVSNAPLLLNTDYEAYSGRVILLTPVTSISVSGLTPLVDYWYQQTQQVLLFPSTVAGKQSANLPEGVLNYTLTDQDGYELRIGIDFFQISPTLIELGKWTPVGSTITANVVVKANPATTSGTNAENSIALNLAPNETLVTGQVFFHTNSGNYAPQSVGADGTITLPICLRPGEWFRWEARVDSGQSSAKAKKYNLNGNVIPGLYLAMGDSVLVGDQCAIIVAPSITETYEVYGSKENLDFTLEVKSNDLQTSSDLSELIKHQLLITRRENMEADGITIFEARRSFAGGSRDSSGTAPFYTYTVSVSASADWKVLIPLVTRMTSFEITDNATMPDFVGKLQAGLQGELAPRLSAFGTSQFLNEYR